jgi:hypothetical protein
MPQHASGFHPATDNSFLSTRPNFADFNLELKTYLETEMGSGTN